MAARETKQGEFVSIIANFDREALRQSYRSARPFPHMKIDGFLTEEAAHAASASFSPFEDARKLGFEFTAVNENLKVQITDPQKFPAPIKQIADALSSKAFLADLSYISGIDNLIWDPTYSGGGMHQTARSGWLDVHVDFNFNEQLQLHRRLNILVYLHPKWEESWGGLIELWDPDVKHREQAYVPMFNRCVVFSTSEISYHGVTAVEGPPGVQRCSFAAYYYTREAPAGWDGTKHTTKFKPRPDEFMKRHVLMPAEAAKRATREGIRSVKRGLKDLLGGK